MLNNLCFSVPGCLRPADKSGPVLMHPVARAGLILAVAWLTLVATWSLASEESAEPSDLQVLHLNEQQISVEIAATKAQQLKGLMFRPFLPDDRGMLFVYEDNKTACMWMKNTLIPLSVAFIDASGRIVNIIDDMKPLQRRTRCSTAEVLYALETNQGWFQTRNIVAGDLVQGLEEIVMP